MAGYASWEFEEGAAIAEGREVLKPLGGGNRYEVALVWDEFLFSLAVAKIIRPDQVGDEKALKDLGREWEVLQATAHPVLVRGFDARLDGEFPHLLIEHLEGPSLRRLIRRGGPLELQQLLPLALHVAGALQYLANAGLVHLDVKPDNIVMGVPPRLIDLSIARSLERAGRSRGPLGTDAYMAPEQCGEGLGLGPIGAAADVWGLGATLHHAISGEVPFPRGGGHADTAEERFPQIAAEPQPLPEFVPAPLRELVAAMLRKDPVERPQAAEVAASLEPLVAALPRKAPLGLRGRLTG
jgi:serine/threonine protein kinase